MKKHSRTFFVKQIPHKYEMFQQINDKSLRMSRPGFFCRVKNPRDKSDTDATTGEHNGWITLKKKKKKATDRA